MSNLSDKDRKAQGKSSGGSTNAPPGPRSVDPRDTPSWTDRLIKDSDERPAACLYNAVLAFSESPIWAGRLSFDESSQRVILSSSPFWNDDPTASWLPRLWTGADDVQATCWLQFQCHIMIGSKLCSEAIESAARQHPFHPIRDYLSSLHWDGASRIDTWLADYMNVDYSPITSAFGARFLISCVARAFSPGCKVDTCLFLEGEQGESKSSAIEVLASKEWATDEVPNIGDKDAAIQLCGKWIVELGETGAFHNVPVSRVKQFLSRSVDRYRPPYGRYAIDVPRGCVFVGTVNSDAYLTDETGARRYWPVLVRGDIDLDALRLVRDHLWAEATHHYLAPPLANGKRRYPWWLDTDELNRLAGEEQAARYVVDECLDPIARYLGGRSDTSVTEVAECALLIPPLKLDQAMHTKITKILKFLNWRAYQPILSDGSRPRRFRPKPEKA